MSTTFQNVPESHELEQTAPFQKKAGLTPAPIENLWRLNLPAPLPPPGHDGQRRRPQRAQTKNGWFRYCA